MIALSLAKPGRNYTIRWNCSCDAEQEMKQTGLCPGETIYLLNSYFGNVIVLVKGKTIALSREIAFYIKV